MCNGLIVGGAIITTKACYMHVRKVGVLLLFKGYSLGYAAELKMIPPYSLIMINKKSNVTEN